MKKRFKNFTRKIKNKWQWYKSFLHSRLPYPFEKKLLNSFKNKKVISENFGLDRGQAIDRVFIERFLFENKNNIKGKLLEFGDDRYSKKYGAKSNEIYIFNEDDGINNVKEDLSNINSLRKDHKYDCIICTNVLSFIYELDDAVRGLSFLTDKKGICLCTVPGISHISEYDYAKWGEYWRFTDKSIKKTFNKYFKNVNVINYGNSHLASLFLLGFAAHEVPQEYFEIVDNRYPLIISVKASNPII